MGEVNVVSLMKQNNAVIGGEGNGGVIYPESHYGRDALVGIALFLSHLALKKCKTSELRDSFPKYCISKNKIQLTPQVDVDNILKKSRRNTKIMRLIPLMVLKYILKRNGYIYAKAIQNPLLEFTLKVNQ